MTEGQVDRKMERLLNRYLLGTGARWGITSRRASPVLGPLGSPTASPFSLEGSAFERIFS